MKYSAKDLKAMTLAQLSQIGETMGLAFNKSHNKAKRAKRILAAQAAAEVDEKTSQAGDLPSPPSPAPVLGEPRPEFERLIDSGRGDPEEDDKTSRQGGERPGAGRPEGMTDEIAMYNRLSKQPHPAIRMIIEKIFDKWAANVGCKAIVPCKEKMTALALSWTHVYEISPAKGMVPPWFVVMCTMVWTTYLVFDDTAQAVREYREQRKSVNSIVVATGSQN